MTHQIRNVMRMAGLIALSFTLVLNQGCKEQGDERLREKAEMEADETSKKEIETGKKLADEQLKAENENIARWSSELEADLEIRQRFFKALRGTYSGNLASGADTYEMKVTFVPSIPPYNSNRTRTVEEVRFELLNLYFNIQVLSWKKSNPLTAVGCRFEQVRPDLENGQINLASEECPNFYSLNIYEIESGIESTKDMISRAIGGSSRELASRVLRAESPIIGNLVGNMQPTTNSNTYEFNLKRVKK